MRCWCALGGIALVFSQGEHHPKKNIVVLLADNVGWASVGFHKPPELPEDQIYTPNLDSLARTGIQLERHYTYKFCSPSRSSFLSGRIPFHVNTYNDDPTMPGAGVPIGMTLLPEVLKEAGYATHFLGKWHIGMASASRQTPKARGFDSSLGYFHSNNDYYSMVRGQGCGVAVDLWDHDAPSRLNGTDYEEEIFCIRAENILEKHSTTLHPVFLYYAFHSSCVAYNETTGETNLQPDPSWYAHFENIDQEDRRKNVAMVAKMDECVGRIVSILKRRDMWRNTVLLWSSDNGGAVHIGGGSNVYPFRGGYFNNFEGGIRAPALLSGGVVESLSSAPRKLDGVIHEADWYATFAGIAGISRPVTDDRAAQLGLPPIDSVDVWPLVTGSVDSSPRVEWPLTSLTEAYGDPRTANYGGDAAYMRFPHKLLVGDIISQAGWCGPIHPNTSVSWNTFDTTINCSWSPAEDRYGCLFNVIDDPSEHNDLASTMPDVATELYESLVMAQTKYFDPNRGQPDERACALANRTGYWQPFQE